MTISFGTVWKRVDRRPYKVMMYRILYGILGMVVAVAALSVGIAIIIALGSLHIGI